MRDSNLNDPQFARASPLSNRLQAAQDGVSMEAEACKIDKKSPAGLQQHLDQLYGGKKLANVVENLIQERRSEASRE